MVKTVEMKGTLRVRITNAGQRDVKYEAELLLSKGDKFQLQQDILATELIVAVKDK